MMNSEMFQKNTVINIAASELAMFHGRSYMEKFKERGQNFLVYKAEYKILEVQNDEHFGNLFIDLYPTFVFSPTNGAWSFHDDWAVWGHYDAQARSCNFWFYGDPAIIREQVAVLDAKYRRAENKAFTTVYWCIATPTGISTTEYPLDEKDAKDSFYPWLNKPLLHYYDEFKESDANILILVGPPGTGKTSFIRSLLRHTRLTGYISFDINLLGSDAFFSTIANERGPVAAVFEDADNILSARSSGNDLMPKFLSFSSGLISTKEKKLIFSTNLPNLSNVDAALIRKGRCFDILEFREYNRDEAAKAYADICPDKPFDLDGSQFTLADLFNTRNMTKTIVGTKVGFV